MTYPTRHEREIMAAFLGGYLEEGAITAITLDSAEEIMRRPVGAGVEIDGMIVSRVLRRLGFNRSYLPIDADTITYRSTK